MGLGKGLFGGAVLAGVFGWSPLSERWPALMTLQTWYEAVIDKAAMMLLSLP